MSRAKWSAPPKMAEIVLVDRGGVSVFCGGILVHPTSMFLCLLAFGCSSLLPIHFAFYVVVGSLFTPKSMVRNWHEYEYDASTEAVLEVHQDDTIYQVYE